MPTILRENMRVKREVQEREMWNFLSDALQANLYYMVISFVVYVHWLTLQKVITEKI